MQMDILQEFNYTEHYKIDADKFDYFEKRFAATAHDERRVHEYIIANIPKEASKLPKLEIPTLIGTFFQTYLKWLNPDEWPDGQRESSASFFSGIFLIVLGFILLISSLFPKPIPSFYFPFLVVAIILFNLI